jgi:anti-anti-sigma factor
MTRSLFDPASAQIPDSSLFAIEKIRYNPTIRPTEERVMEIKVFSENGRVPVTVMHVDGNIDSSTNGAFQAKADELIANGARFILVDLSHTKFISSAGFRAFNDLFNKLRSFNRDTQLSEEEIKKGITAGTYKSPHLKLLNLSDEARTAFELAGFDLFIETFTDLKTAVASF